MQKSQIKLIKLIEHITQLVQEVDLDKMSAKIITVAVIKGGTGKTTTCAALAQAAAANNKKVLAIDLDAQANLTAALGADPAEPGAYQLLHGAPIAETIQETAQEIDVISGAAILADEISEKNSVYRLEKALQPVLKYYDLIIIDTPPSLCELTYNALQAANGLLITTDADLGSLRGMYLLLDIAKEARQTNKKLKVLGSCITRYNGRPKINQYMRDVIAEQGAARKCPLLCEIRQGIAIQEAQAYKKSLFDYAPKSNPAKDYLELYKLIMK